MSRENCSHLSGNVYMRRYRLCLIAPLKQYQVTIIEFGIFFGNVSVMNQGCHIASGTLELLEHIFSWNSDIFRHSWIFIPESVSSLIINTEINVSD